MIAATTQSSETHNGKSSSASGTKLSLLTESRLKTRRRCAREHQIRYELGYESTSADREALRFGTLVHLGLESWWKTHSIEDALASLASAESEDAYELVRAEELLRGYDARWGDEPFEVIGVELEFRAPLINPDTGAASKTWQLGGKLDALAIDRNGRTVIVEHKTSGKNIGAGSVYWARLRMDGQVSGYFRGAEALGHPAEVCLYDVIGKIKLRPCKATPAESRRYTKAGKLDARQRETDETIEEYRTRVQEEIAGNPDKYYQRGEVVRLESEMRAHDLDTWQTAGMMRDGRRLGIAPKNTDACERFESLCQYFPICTGEASLDDERLYQLLPSVHPELTDSPREVGKP